MNSTFEWSPGVPVHHSRNLRNWRLIGHNIGEKRPLDLRGVADSAGVWAPSLSHTDGKFRFAGIVIRECDPAAGRLTGERHKILRKPDILTKGRNLYQKYGWYYLMLTEELFY